MVETPTKQFNHGTINSQLDNERQYRFNEINKTKYYFIVEIHKREKMSKIINRYVATFDYFDKTLLVFISSRS